MLITCVRPASSQLGLLIKSCKQVSVRNVQGTCWCTCTCTFIYLFYFTYLFFFLCINQKYVNNICITSVSIRNHNVSISFYFSCLLHLFVCLLLTLSSANIYTVSNSAHFNNYQPTLLLNKFQSYCVSMVTIIC